jgi:sterol desaturase/sphingolipid hydroxylase (fatty acid hydroxylase superfamily)
MLWVLVSGASMEVLILRQTFQTVANIFAHTALRLPDGPNSIIEWIFVTPNFHHVHHHFQMPATNYNYGDVFSVWDRLFGTSARMPSQEIVFGLDTHMDYSWLGFKDQHPAKTS